MYNLWSHALAVNHETLAGKTFIRCLLNLEFLVGVRDNIWSVSEGIYRSIFLKGKKSMVYGSIHLFNTVGMGEYGRPLAAYESTQCQAKAICHFNRQRGGSADGRHDLQPGPHRLGDHFQA